MKIVVDSSVIVKWLSKDKEENIEQADKLLKETEKGKIELIAPELAKYEVGNVLLFSKKLSANSGAIALGQLAILPIIFVSESIDLSIETYNIAAQFGVTYYDAAFMALAKKYDAILITENVKHQGKSKGIKIKSLQDF